MSEFKFNIDPKEPNDDRIVKHKDFGKVMQNYQKMTRPLYKTPLYKNPKIFLWIVLILVVIWLVAEFADSEEKQIKKSPSDSARIDSSHQKKD